MAYMFGFFFGRTPLIKVNHCVTFLTNKCVAKAICVANVKKKTKNCFLAAFSKEDLGRLYRRLLLHSGLWLYCKFIGIK